MDCSRCGIDHLEEGAIVDQIPEYMCRGAIWQEMDRLRRELKEKELQLSEAKALLQRFLDAGPEEEYEVILCKLSGDVEKFLEAK